MGDTKPIDRAAQRATEMDLEYAGALTPEEAHQMAQEEPGAVIVDVRTAPEILYVGYIPDSIAIDWQVYPDMTVNERFMDELEQKVPKDSTVMFLCRSGVRSHHAAKAAAQAGWTKAYNILEGFEGDLDGESHRGDTGGWRHRRLPWKQG